ncbi:MAG TPA: hypothetical protein VKD70_06475 [Candidatus Acidoferrum sp.]|nr:hypothetical protein [Candidatus Acidoferrum sp.]
MELFLIALLALISAGAAHMVFRASRTYLKFRGKRIVSCPENHLAAAVDVSAAKAAMQSAVGSPHLALSQCSRWPEREDCGQECLAQIEEAPKACLVRTVVNQWYTGKECVFCHNTFHEIHWHDHPSALLDPENHTIEWKDIPAENLQQTFRTHLPVCWNCHIAQTFRRVHPELVVTRPPH